MTTATVEVIAPSENKQSQSKPYTAPPRQIWGWAVGRVAEFGLISTFGQALAIFTVGFGLSPVIVGWCMMLPRLVDGILDPLIGHWSDDSHSRWGRRKPFMIGGAFLGAFFLSLLWWADPSWNSTVLIVYLSLIGTFLYLCYGTYTMAWTAIGYELSDDYHERSKVAAIGGFVLAIVALGNSWIYWLALRPTFGGVIWGMRWIGAAIAVLVIISAIISVKLTRERFAHTNREHVPIWAALKTTLKNRPFVTLLLMKVCEILGGRLTGGVSFYLGVYYVCRGDQDLATRIGGIAATLGTVWNFAVLPLVKPASKLIGKRGALITGAALGFVTSLIAPFITTPEHPYWGLIPGLIVAPLLVISGTIAGAIVPDICDVDELEQGQRREGLFTSVMGFFAKLEISLATVLVGYIVSWSAVDTAINNRWTSMANGKNEAVAGFAVGETTAFGFAKPTTFDTYSVFLSATDATALREFELATSNESATQGFTTIGRFQTKAGAEGYQDFSFAPATAKFLRVKLMEGQTSGDKITLHEMRLSNSKEATSPNLLSPDHGGKVLAAMPPEPVTKRLYWLVMIPGIVFSFLTLVMTLLFPLTEKAMVEVRRALDERRLLAAAIGIPTDEVVEEKIRQHPELADEALDSEEDYRS